MTVPVRYRPEGFELQCSYCREFLPLTVEFWRVTSGLARCKACWAAYFAARQRGYSAVQANREAKRDSDRARYRANRISYNAANRAWKATHKAETAAYNREYRARNRQRLVAQGAAYYAEARPVILMKKRLAYRERAA
jgi:hypothetical protein